MLTNEFVTPVGDGTMGEGMGEGESSASSSVSINDGKAMPIDAAVPGKAMPFEADNATLFTGVGLEPRRLKRPLRACRTLPTASSAAMAGLEPVGASMNELSLRRSERSGGADIRRPWRLDFATALFEGVPGS